MRGCPVTRDGMGPMRHGFLTGVVFCLVISAGAPPAQGAGQGKAEHARHDPVERGAVKTLPIGLSAPQAVTVAQLAETIEAARNKSDEDAAKELEQLELTERLSSPELARLTAELPGAKSKAALMAVGDASVFLEPPKAEMVDKPAPDGNEQRQIVQRAEDYLEQVIPKLPDFYARRITSVFKIAWTPGDKQDTKKRGPLHPIGTFEAKVLYRDRKEVVHAQGPEQGGLIIQGIFGPVLAAVIRDNLRSSMQWHGWEDGPNGAMAVFEFQVPRKDSHYGVSLPAAGVYSARRVGYRGEIGIDPDTGTILRLVLQSDPVLAVHAFEHADIMLEYGPVVIGGKTYTCAVRGVSISTARYQEAGIVRRDRAFILLDDVVFTDYHVFRSEMRIVPE